MTRAIRGRQSARIVGPFFLQKKMGGTNPPLAHCSCLRRFSCLFCLSRWRLIFLILRYLSQTSFKGFFLFCASKLASARFFSKLHSHHKHNTKRKKDSNGSRYNTNFLVIAKHKNSIFYPPKHERSVSKAKDLNNIVSFRSLCQSCLPYELFFGINS